MSKYQKIAFPLIFLYVQHFPFLFWFTTIALFFFVLSHFFPHTCLQVDLGYFKKNVDQEKKVQSVCVNGSATLKGFFLLTSKAFVF